MQTIHGRVLAIACVWATGAALAHCGGLDGSTIDPNDCHVVHTCGSAVESGIPGDAPGADNTVPGDAPEGGGPGQEAGSETSEASPCPAPTSLDCNGTCVDPTLPANCGSCGHACPAADGGQATCMAGGICGVSCDPNSATPVNCNGACVNVQTDPLHCGSCTVACPPAASGHGTAMCAATADGGGACGLVCTAGTPGSPANPGYHLCMGDCLPNTDAPSVAGDPCVISDGFGVFVSPGGSDAAGNGSRTMPYATLGNAIDKAVAQGGTRRVYACASAGSFVENLVVGAARDAVSVFGGFDCTTSPGTWTYSATLKTTVAPPSGYALKVTGLTQGVTFEDFVFRAADATSPGGSSIAVFVSGAQNLAFHRLAMVAGAGVTGAPGASGGTTGNPSNWYSGSLNGNDAMAGVPAAANSCKCGDGTKSTGGQGGSRDPTIMQTPGAGTPAYGGAFAAAGTNGQDCGSGGGTGGSGIDAPAGVSNLPSASHGTLSGAGWTPAIGTPASNGKVGQGGGGGGDGPANRFGNGGGGACGGCGGAAGKPGGGGGSSIALVSYQSTVSLVACTLTGANAGGGGAGGTGEGGQLGGPAGMASNFSCQGGSGGNGAGGNGGQGGAGGLSLGVGYSGMMPALDSTTTTTVGGLGAGGQGGAPGGAVPGSNNPGADGAKGPDGVMQTTPLAL